MPVVTISLFRGRDKNTKFMLCETIKKSIKDIFKIKHDNFHHRINEYDNTDMFVPNMSTQNYLSIELDIMPGRSSEDKEKLYIKIQEELERFGISKQDLIIIIRDVALENWFIRGNTGRRQKEINQGII